MSLLLILTLMLTLSSNSIMSVSCNHYNEKMISVKETGKSSVNCCVYGKCYCSNLSLALEHVRNNTEIRIMSNVSLHGVPQFESTNDSNITIIGYNNPTVECNNQGGFVGRNVGHIIIQNIVWDRCGQETEIDGFINAHITECSFQNTVSLSFSLTLRGSGLIYINNSVFFNFIDGGVYLNVDSNNSSKASSITVYNSTFNNAPLTVAINESHTGFHNGVLNVTIIKCNFSNNEYYNIYCNGTDNLPPRVSIISSSFVSNRNTAAVNAENCDITLQNNCSFLDNRSLQSLIMISYGTINMIGPVLFYNNYVSEGYGGAVRLFNSNMSVNKGPIKFHNNTAVIGGAIYMCNNSNIFANITDLEFYNNTAILYGGAFYIEASLCENNERSIPFYYNMLIDTPYATSNSAGFGGNFVYFFAYDASDCIAPHMPYKIGNLFATQPYSVLSTHEAVVHGNFSDFHTFSFWLHDLHFNLIVTDCFNNLYGLVKVAVDCNDGSDENYQYTIDSAHNNVTMLSNQSLKCNIDKSYTFQLTANVSIKEFCTGIPPYIPISTQIDVKINTSSTHEENCEKDIAHFFTIVDSNIKCVSLSCQYSQNRPAGIDCLVGYGYFSVTSGYWFSNGFTEFADNCPLGHCSNTFDLYDSIYAANVSVNVSYPNSNDQCVTHWTGLVCGECDKEHLIIHDSTSCVPSDKCLLHNLHVLQLVLFFLISLLYWIAVISLIFVLLHFRFNITAGYAYGIIFYYSVLEQTVNASYIGTQNNSNNPFITMCLTILSSIGNMKPPFQILKFCFGKFLVMDHMFLTYIHPVIVTILIIIIFISARKFVTVARVIGRYVNSKSICILLMLSYSSITYTSVQLFRPLAIYHTYPLSNKYTVWHVYLSATVKYLHGRHIAYCIIAILCEVIVGIGFPFILLIQPYLTKYFNINFISIMPVLDQLKGCYKQEYRWFTAYYLLCRQVIYAVDIGTDFIPNYKYGLMVMVYVLIMMFHVWLQPYKQRRLNILDSTILMTLMLVYIGEHTSYGSTIVLWIIPLVLFINCITFSSRLKYLLIPVSSLVLFILTLFLILYNFLDGNLLFVKESSDYSFYYINYIIALISFIIPFACLIYFFAYLLPKTDADTSILNVQNEDSYEDSDSNEDT